MTKQKKGKLPYEVHSVWTEKEVKDLTEICKTQNEKIKQNKGTPLMNPDMIKQEVLRKLKYHGAKFELEDCPHDGSWGDGIWTKDEKNEYGQHTIKCGDCGRLFETPADLVREVRDRAIDLAISKARSACIKEQGLKGSNLSTLKDVFAELERVGKINMKESLYTYAFTLEDWKVFKQKFGVKP